MDFVNYCKKYIKSLSYADLPTLDLDKLGYEAATHTPRLREPVFCYAYALNRQEKLFAAVKDYDFRLFEEYKEIYNQTEHNFDKFFVELARIYATGYFRGKAQYSGSEWLPKEYAKVYQAWRADCGRKKKLLESKNGVREFFLRHHSAYPQLTAHKMIKELDLDTRNTYAFLHGNCGRVSLKTAHKIFSYIVDYVEKYEEGKIIID